MDARQTDGERPESVPNLIRKVDKAYHDTYDKVALGYYYKIWKPILPVGLLLLVLLIATILDMFVFPLSLSDRIGVGLSLMALAVSLYALIVAMASTLKPQMRLTEEKYIFSKIERLNPSDYPIVKGLIRMRVKSLTVDLYDIYEVDHAVFELREILKKLVG